MIKPPHFWLSVLPRFVPLNSPVLILSKEEVKIIGFKAVPWASILAPLAIIKAEDSVEAPSLPWMIVPAWIVKVTPSVTTTFPSRK